MSCAKINFDYCPDISFWFPIYPRNSMNFVSLTMSPTPASLKFYKNSKHNLFKKSDSRTKVRRSIRLNDVYSSSSLNRWVISSCITSNLMRYISSPRYLIYTYNYFNLKVTLLHFVGGHFYLVIKPIPIHSKSFLLKLLSIRYRERFL